MIYFIQINNEDGYIKIGVARDVNMRIASIQTSNPYEIKLLGTIKNVSDNDDAFFENKIHEMFHRFLVRGEWFQPAQEILDYIHENCTGDISIGVTWDELISIEPRLLDLIEMAKQVKDDGKSSEYCSFITWKYTLKEETQKLVGWYSENDNRILRNNLAFEIVRDKMIEHMPKCRNCWCEVVDKLYGGNKKC